MNISVIIPIYNEEKVIAACLESLSLQTKQVHEVIVVDDGSTDRSLETVHHTDALIKNIKVFTQSHLGPGAARNRGAKKATGEILVFVDSDMTFSPDFIKVLIDPIERGKTTGTFTKEEYVSNWENVWARCWNFNQRLIDKRRIPKEYPDTAPVFRAILKKEFDKVGGYTEGVGWTDDWTLSEKLGYKSTSTNAICYHANPSSLGEVFFHASWIGKNQFISKNFFFGLISAIRYSPIFSFTTGLFKSVLYKEPLFFIFKLVYDLGIEYGIVKSFLSKNRNK